MTDQEKFEVQLKSIPTIIKALKQWVAFKVWKGGDGKLEKVPINPHTGKGASSTNPEHWGTFDEALAACKKYGCKAIAFALTKSDPYFFVDLDKCISPETGEVQEWALQIVKDLNSYTEKSVSATGLHIIGQGIKPPGKKKKEQLEIYDRFRFAIMTGDHWPETPTNLMPRQKELEELHASVFGVKEQKQEKVRPTCGLSLSDDQVVQQAIAKNGEKFKSLWEGNWHDSYSSHSEADLALCGILAYWANCDSQKIDRLFQNSGLMRDKWNEKHRADGATYGHMTIEKALSGSLNGPAPSGPDGKELVDIFIKRTKEDPKAAIREALSNEASLNAMADLSKRDRGSYESILLEVQDSGASAREVDSFKKAVNAAKKNHLRLVEPGDTKELTLAKEIFPDAPIGNDIVIPGGWHVSEEGVFKEKLVGSPSKGFDIQRVQASFSPILIQKKMEDISDSTEAYQSIWLSEGQWKSLHIERGDMADSRLIVKCAENGLPVITPWANLVVEYLAAFEAVNSGRFPKGKISSHMGWQGTDGSQGFLWGENFIASDGTVYKKADIEKCLPHELPSEIIYLKPNDPGTRQIVSGFNSRCGMTRWLLAMSKTEDYPLVGFAVFASLAAPLLSILDMPNFVIDFAYDTSSGKTTTLKAAASCWGNPNERSSGSLVRSWDSTRVFAERGASLVCSMPLILDETKRAKHPDQVAQFIYDFTGGQGRGRGNLEGTRKTESWRTILLSSGESKLTNFTSDAGGAHARVLSLWGAPFGKPKKHKADMINKFNTMIEANYGWAGQMFVSYLIRNREKWPDWKGHVQNLTEKYRDLAGNNGPAQRQAEYFAVIHFAAILSYRCWKNLDNKWIRPWDIEETMAAVHKVASRELTDVDRAKEALDLVFSWANAHSNRFYGRAEEANFAGYLGVWPKGDGWKHLAFLPHELEDFLRKKGFEPLSVLKIWRDRKWLKTDGLKALKTKVTLDGERTRCYVVKRLAFR